MNRKWVIKIHACICATAVFLVACGTKASIVTNPMSAKNEAVELGAYADLILSKEQMLSDYDNMWNALEESYPFWGVLSRKYTESQSHDDVIGDYRMQIENMEVEGDDAMWRFIEIISNSLYDVCGSVGHAGILNPHYFRDFHSANEKYLSEIPDLQPWVDLGRKQEVNYFYEYYDYLIARLLEKQAGTESEEKTEEPSFIETQSEPNLTMEKLSENDKIAYIRVDSFEDSMMEHDLPEIRRFLNEVKEYNHLIIDTRNNSGGNTVYWENAFVRPNISESMNYRTLRLMADTDLTRRFYGAGYQDSHITIEDIKSDSNLVSLHREDLTGMVYAREILDTVEPEFDERLFEGKIWLLTSPEMFSSAEAFAVFCKETGFATLVGQATGGSNSGGAVWYELPESHLLVAFDVEYCLNPDGSCNMETGTAPDFKSNDALSTVLELIGHEDGGI